MFDGKYFDWNQKRIKGIVDYYGYKFFYGKKLADLGCGHADLSGVLYRLGSEITAVDARQEHLKIVTKKFPGIKVVKGNLDGPWPFHGQNFDIILDLGLLCHLASFENHLKAVCASTTYLVLETAVCDSDDDNKCVQVPEGKEVYDLSYNGMGCRPSVAAIERVLSACHMSFKRMDSSKFNSGGYVYDWVSKGDGTTDINKRRIWFCTRNQPGVSVPESAGQIQPAVVVTPPPANPLQLFNRTGIPTILTAHAKPPLSAMMSHPTPVEKVSLDQSGNYVELKRDSLDFQVMKNSKEFSLITPETYAPPNIFPTNGIILPNTLSSRMWMKKIAPLYPSLKVSSKAFDMAKFSKAGETPTLVMSSIDRLITADRIWIEEWYGNNSLTQEQINILSVCSVIMTPSQVNAQTILAALPSANVQRMEKPWPMLNVDAIKYDYFLYFEKDPDVTKNVLNCWDNRFGKIIVVGSRAKLPSFAEFVSDAADYESIFRLLMGAKAVLDISTNNHYMSGILTLAHRLNLPVITNNQYYLNQHNIVPITINSKETNIPSTIEISKSISRFLAESVKTPAKFDSNYNHEVDSNVKKLLGV